jgi:hypothetical protein
MRGDMGAYWSSDKLGGTGRSLHGIQAALRRLSLLHLQLQSFAFRKFYMRPGASSAKTDIFSFQRQPGSDNSPLRESAWTKCEQAWRRVGP